MNYSIVGRVSALYAAALGLIHDITYDILNDQAWSSICCWEFRTDLWVQDQDIFSNAGYDPNKIQSNKNAMELMTKKTENEPTIKGHIGSICTRN